MQIGTGVRVTVSPVTASPEFQPEETALLARFYSALWIEVQNGASSAVTIDPAGALIFDQTGTPWVALGKAQREEVLRWQAWSWRSWLARWWWTGRIEQMMRKLDRLQLETGALAAGEVRRGILVFKVIPTPMCRLAELEWTPTPVENGPTVPSDRPGTVPQARMAPVRMALEC